MYIQLRSTATLVVGAYAFPSAPASLTGGGMCNQAGGQAASTSMYNWQGSACDLGQKDWQWAPGQTKNGYYYGAVSQRVFQGGLPSGLPNCGSACGQCFDLETTGVNHYNGGIGKGSHIILMVIDACYSSSSEWCKNLTPEGNLQDSAGCEVHFDIQTGPPNGPGTPVNAMGTDGQEWPYGGQIVNYNQVPCPSDHFVDYNSVKTCPA